jgi:hypothetical protein
VSAKSWAVAVLAVIALCVVVGLSLAANLDFVLIGLAIVAALVGTYLVGRRDNPDGDGGVSGPSGHGVAGEPPPPNAGQDEQSRTGGEG